MDFKMRVGSRRQVWNGTAKETPGGLKKKDIFKDKYGRLKSRRASKKAKRNQNLKRAGWVVQKGKFGAVRKSEVTKKTKSKKKKSSKRSSKKKRSKRQRGGDSCTLPGR